ncbi:hypothetical protein DFQ28_004154 [Apophysomyces sp. BC1034]|nr:hypothetical protein DFQ29_009131 [Apophysomyces sp. BC1021]KAG0188929.1 hypothetical protein DFQ28_004154 [Apophysomyces sp. BC1034]
MVTNEDSSASYQPFDAVEKDLSLSSIKYHNEKNVATTLGEADGSEAGESKAEISLASSSNHDCTLLYDPLEMVGLCKSSIVTQGSLGSACRTPKDASSRAANRMIK